MEKYPMTEHTLGVPELPKMAKPNCTKFAPSPERGFFIVEKQR
jgi:hypothetical protein